MTIELKKAKLSDLDFFFILRTEKYSQRNSFNKKKNRIE